MPDRGPQTRGGRAGSAWLRAGLVLSLALNLAIAGVLLGAALGGRPGAAGPPREIARDLGLGPYLRALPDGERRAIGRAVLREREGPSPRAALRESFAQVLDALRSEPFDAGRVSALLAAQAAAAEQVRQAGQGALVARLEAMTPEARRAYADRLEAALRRRHAARPGDAARD
jgi:hypothetical protein